MHAIVGTTVSRSMPLFLGAISTVSWAGNGFLVIGYGAESLSMGGADVALSRDTGAVLTNPAGLTQVERGAFDISVDPFYHLSTAHRDALGNDRTLNDTRSGAFFGSGYAHRLHERLVGGVSLSLQGGVGLDYSHLDSGFGTRGDISSSFGIFTLAQGIGWQVSETLSIGATAGVSYGQGKQRFFEDTSAIDDGEALFGSRLDGLDGWGLSAVLGMQYQVSETLTVAAAYHSKTKLSFDGGSMTVNYEALDQGRVRYRDVRFDGFALAQSLRAGFALQVREKWLLSFELGWLDWSGALGDLTLTARKPAGGDPEVVPAELTAVTSLRLRDQYAVALGTEYAISDGTVLRAGYNYVRQPVPRQHLTPLLAAIPAHHYMLGVGQNITERWVFNIGVQYQQHTSVDYENAAQRISRDATAVNEVVYLHLTLGRRW